MSENKFTPGPWWTNGRYSGTDMGCAIIAARTDAGELPGNPTRGMVGFASAIMNTDARICEANARLIAAAPDLLAALDSAIRKLSVCALAGGNDPEFVDAMLKPYRDLLAEIRGEA